MRLTIEKRKRQKRKQKRMILISLFIIVPLLTISIGYVLSRNIIVPYINEQSKAKEKENQVEDISQKSKLSLKSIDMYNIEIDKFDSLEKAKKLLSQLNDDSILGYVSESQGYIVYTSLTLDKSEVESQYIYIKEKYPKSNINNVKINEKDLLANSTQLSISKDMKNTVSLLNHSYKSELTLWLSKTKEFDYEILKKQIDKNNADLKTSLEKYSSKFTSGDVDNEDLAKLYLILHQNVEEREKISQEFNIKEEESVKNTYYEFVKSLFNYVNYYKV